MKDASISIISYSKLWGRTINLLQSSSFRNENMRIYAQEPEKSYECLYSRSEWNANWMEALKYIATGLEINVKIANNLPYNKQSETSPTKLRDWMKPRQLEIGELSVIYKHYKAIEDFLRSNNDYCLIFEDDALVSEDGLNFIRKILHDVRMTKFDFIDFAGGDNLRLTKSTEIPTNEVKVQNITWRSSRTACCYAINRRYAEAFHKNCRIPFMPIDWMLSYVAAKNQFNVAWIENGYIRHGSSIGEIKSWRKNQ